MKNNISISTVLVISKSKFLMGMIRKCGEHFGFENFSFEDITDCNYYIKDISPRFILIDIDSYTQQELATFEQMMNQSAPHGKYFVMSRRSSDDLELSERPLINGHIQLPISIQDIHEILRSYEESASK